LVDAETPPAVGLFVKIVGVESPTFRLIISLNRVVEKDSRRDSPVGGGVLAPVDCPPTALPVPDAGDEDNGMILELLVTTDKGAAPVLPYPKGVEQVAVAVVGVVVAGLSLSILVLLLVRLGGGGGGRVGSKKSGGGFEGKRLNAILAESPALLDDPSTESTNCGVRVLTGFVLLPFTCIRIIYTKCNKSLTCTKIGITLAAGGMVFSTLARSTLASKCA
jgi:hypothetical protein